VISVWMTVTNGVNQEEGLGVINLNNKGG